jgi:putative ABC transport system ATP-binding protein
VALVSIREIAFFLMRYKQKAGGLLRMKQTPEAGWRMPMALIEAQGLIKHYRMGQIEVKALNGVDIELAKGEFSVLAGRSGSGKTTLLNIIGALDLPDHGKVVINGEDFLSLSKNERAEFRLRRIGFIFQAYNLIRVLNARENVAYVLQLQGVAKKERLEIADQWLEEVDLADMGHRRPDQLSGGQQQRVAVARALASGPAIVLADEPTANLDSHTGASLIELMHHLNEEHSTTFLIASHDPQVIEAAKRLIRMEDGKIVGQESR